MVPEIPLKIGNCKNNMAASLVILLTWIRPGSIRLRIDQILWIRIRILSIRIRTYYFWYLNQMAWEKSAPEIIKGKNTQTGTPYC